MKRVLIIDDDTDTCEMLELLLIGEGYNAQAISDRSKAIEKVITFSPHVVICDYYMNGISFETFREQLRTIRREIRIVLLTGSPKGISYAQINGICCLKKPLDLDHLKSVIDGVLESGEHVSIGDA